MLGPFCPRFVLASGVGALLLACTASAPSAPVQNVTIPSAAPAPTAEPDPPDVALHATDRESLRRNHPGLTEDAPCAIDGNCTSPLRCYDGTCVFPPAMTGEVREDLPAVRFATETGEHRFVVETAVTFEEMRRGMMHRRTIAPGFGMIFLYGDERRRSFWMSNTLVSLDIIYVDGRGVVDSIAHDATPLSERSLPSNGPARYVIEVEAGRARALGITPGTRVIFENLPDAHRPR